MKFTMKRRDFLGAASAAAALPLAAAPEAGAKASDSASGVANPEVQFGDAIAIAPTNSGKVRGFIKGGIFTFRGIPYGDTTAGANRFMPPKKPQPWTTVRDCRAYGPVCPQPARANYASDESFMLDWDDGHAGEDCLRLNVWTPALDGKARPVLFWIHGGGYFGGSSQGLASYDGENLCRRGDVVMVSMNHRIGVLGFLDLSKAGPQYERSVNIGMLDLIAALEWVRDNIAGFGGDPKNVTISGQSGGGGKVGTLMAMPAAKGLFHKATIQSGSELAQGSRESKQRLAAATLANLNLTMDQAAQLQDMPLDRLIAAGAAALTGLTLPPKTLAPPGFERIYWGPSVDGKDLPRQPFEPDAPPQSADIPLLVGSTRTEIGGSLRAPELENINLDEAKQNLAWRYGDRAGPIIDAYRAAFPKAKPIELLAYAQVPRVNAVHQAERKAAQPAPVYLYWFGWNTKVLDGRARSFHCMELPFVFDNTDRCAVMTGGTAEARALAARVSDAWIAFMRTGNPNHKDFPAWPRFDAKRGAVMLIDNTPMALDDPDRVPRLLTEA
jgi:para-nitrobenzyl esterase